VTRGGRPSHPEWWSEHPDELLAALAEAARSPDFAEPTTATDQEVVIEDVEYWIEHPGELLDGLVVADALREPPGLDLDALRVQRMRDATWEPERDDRGHELGR